MKSLIIVTTLLFTFSLWGNDLITFPETSFDIQTENALDKLKDTLFNPENLLAKYQPAGAEITKKSVDKGEVQFYATKKVLMLSKTIFIHGNFSVAESDNCILNEKGYIAELDLAGSDRELTENIEKYETLLCIQEKSSNNLHIKVKVKLHKGNHYSTIVGTVMSNMMAAQTSPLIKAITDEVTEK